MGSKKNEQLTDEERRRKRAEYARLRRKNFSDEEKRKHDEAQRRSREKRRQENIEYMRKRRLTKKGEEERVKNAEYQRRRRAQEKLDAERGIVKPVDQEVVDNLKLNRRRRDQLKKKQLDELKINDPVKYREHLEKIKFKNLLKRCQITEEEKEKRRQQRYLSDVALEATLTPEELEERRRKKIASSVKSQRKRRENETEEEKQQRQIYEKIRAWKWKLRKELFDEGLSKEEVKRRADEQEDIWWREVYPGGRPPCRRRGRPVKNLDLYSVPVREPCPKAAVEVFKFNCVKWHPLWRSDAGAWQPVGFNQKSELLKHVLEKHLSCYFLCDKCNLLKYSKKALDIHAQYCLNKS